VARAAIVLLSLVALACSAAVPPRPRPSPTVVTPSARASADLAASPEVERPKSNPCHARGVPKPIAVRSPRAPDGCRRPEPSLARALTAELQKLYRPHATGARLDVAFQCGSAGELPDRIVLERGEGHGFSLELWELVRAGDHYDVRGVLYAKSPYRTGPSSDRGYRLARGEIALSAIAREAPRARALLGSRLEEVPPRLPPGTIGGFSIGISSRNFYKRLELDAPDGGETRVFTGYETNGEDSRVHLPLELAATPLETLLEPMPRDDREAEPADRALFAESFVRTLPRFTDQFWWWVAERYVELASELGGPDLVPPLLDLVGKLPADNRLAQKSLIAIESISGFSLSRDAHGDLVPPAVARERVLAECR
jgi:hypothetical protein